MQRIRPNPSRAGGLAAGILMTLAGAAGAQTADLEIVSVELGFWGLGVSGDDRIDHVVDGQGDVHVFVETGEPRVDSGGVEMTTMGRRLRYLRRSNGIWSEETLYTATGSKVILELRVALTSQDVPCVAWIERIENVNLAYIGCRNAGGFSIEAVEGSFASHGGHGLAFAFDDADLPHLVFYHHFPAPEFPGQSQPTVDHRVQHVWFDGSDWLQEAVPIPPELPQGSLGASENACLAIDGDVLHVAMGAGTDTLPESTFDLSLVYNTKAPAGGWSSGVVVKQEPAGGGMVDVTRCRIAVAPDGTPHILYAASADGNPTRLFHTHLDTSSWPEEELQGVGVLPAEPAIDAAGNVLLGSRSDSGFHLVRNGSAEALFEGLVSPLASPGGGASSLRLASDGRCDVVYVSEVTTLEQAIVHVEVPACASASIPDLQPDYLGSAPMQHISTFSGLTGSLQLLFRTFGFGSIDLSARQADGSPISGLPGSASFDEATGLFTWPADTAAPGIYPLIFSGSDATGKVATEHVTIHFSDPAGFPAFSHPITDEDGDYVPDEIDSCLGLANGPEQRHFEGSCLAPPCYANQKDSDRDGFGNVCDADFNNDGVVNVSDWNLFSPYYNENTTENGGTADPELDMNGDGVVNISDFLLFQPLYNTPPGPSGLACVTDPPSDGSCQ